MRDAQTAKPQSLRTGDGWFAFNLAVNLAGWLEEDPDASAVELLKRLQEAEPERFSRAHLRTLQRRVQKWRAIMASKLVYAGSAEVARNTCDLSELPLSMDGLESRFFGNILNEATGPAK